MSKHQSTRKRHLILALVFVTVVINYLDRTNISVAAKTLQEELGISGLQMGIIFSAFAWTYTLLQIPGGILADQVRPKKLYSWLLVIWSTITLLQGFCSNTISFILCRIGIGAAEAPSFPMNNRIVTRWFPEDERASAIAIYTSGQFIGLALLMPVLTIILDQLGWQLLFIISGLLGILWAAVWYFYYFDPDEHPSLDDLERQRIGQGGGAISDAKTKEKDSTFSWADVRLALSYRKLWGIYLGQFCLGTLFVFFLTWFPTYLNDERGIDLKQSGLLASLPFLAAFAGVLLSGTISDFLIRKDFSAEFARKTPVLTGMLLSSSVIAVNYTQSNALMIAFLCLSFFGNGLASINWVFISLIAPIRLLGLVGGVFNFIGGISAVVTPIIIGFLIDRGSFSAAFVYISIVTLIGFLSYVFLVGKVERIEELIHE